MLQYGNVNEQVANASLQLASIPELRDGFDAIGFSQGLCDSLSMLTRLPTNAIGGQFLRAYVERYNDPPIHNLITFGSQHMGVSDIPLCRPWDVLCQLARVAARKGVYTDYAQENLVQVCTRGPVHPPQFCSQPRQAQYYRDPKQLPQYLAHNRFLASINNEVDDDIDETYADNLSTLNKLVLVLFSEDVTVVPKESSWFGSYAPPEESRKPSFPGGVFDKMIIPMRLQTLYIEDRIGLRALDERGDVVLEICEGVHMELNSACWDPIIKRYVGGIVWGGRDLTAHEVLTVQQN